MQQTLVILIVAACVLWLGVLVFRYFRPQPGGKACAGGCCDGQEKLPAPDSPAPAARTQMVSSEDLRARLKARHG